MDDQIRKIVAELPGLTSVTGVWEVAGDRFAQGDRAFVEDLGIALSERYGSAAEEVWQYRSVLNRLVQMLATTEGPGNAVQAVRLVSSTGIGTPRLDRYLASMLASSHRSEDLAAVFAGGASDELCACLIQELVLRGVVVAETPGIADWTASPQWSRHPLGRLPLTLSDVEEHRDLPHYGSHGSSHQVPYGPSKDRDLAVTAGTRVPPAEEMTTQAAAALMARAVANWAEESNGRIEARGFDFAEPLETESVPDALLTLGLECLNGAGDEFSVAACPPSHTWRLLFAAASTGGAYNFGSSGAYGRLAAWQSMAGLSGAAEDAKVDEVEARARDCTWYAFEAETSWFERVAWDIGLATMTPDRRRLTVLAATDTD